MKRVIGDFHISPDSRTYKELYMENRELRESAAGLQGKLDAAAGEAAALRKQLAEKETEIMLLRARKPAQPETQPRKVKRKNKGIGRLFHKAPKPLTEDEKKETLLNVLIRNRSFSDAQLLYLSNILSKSVLPGDAMARLFDARLTVPRMRQVYCLLCSKHGVREDIGAGMESADAAAPSSGGAQAAAVPATKQPVAKEAADDAQTGNTISQEQPGKLLVLVDTDDAAGSGEDEDSSMERLLAFRKSYDALTKAGR